MNDFVSHFTFYSSSTISAIKEWKLISLIAWKIKLETSNWPLIFVLVTFSFHILICIFILHPILLYSGCPESSSNSQTSFLRGQCVGCGQGSHPRVGGSWKSGWSSGHMGWDADGMGLGGYSSSQSSWACRCLSRLCCLWPAVHQDLWKVFCTFWCAECSNLSGGILGVFTEKCHMLVGNRLQTLVTVCQQGSKQVFRALSVPNQKVKGDLQPMNTTDSTGFFCS